MAVLDSGLETIVDYGQPGWSKVHDSNIEKLNDNLLGPFQADNALGILTRLAASGMTIQTLTDSTTGTPSTTISAVSSTGDDATINNNFSSLTAQQAKTKADLEELQTVLNDLIGKLKKTGGCGVLDNDP
jgi:hypothetical protein